MTSLIPAAKLSALSPGQGTAVEVAGYRLALFRQGDRVYALDEACPHAEGPLSQGEVEGATVYCPWHGWAFDLASGRCRQGAHVRSYPTEVRGDDVYVALTS
ncbi:MAG: Rieske 2Fe-2S domain-containing protein [Planctomycetota bacterium]